MKKCEYAIYTEHLLKKETLVNALLFFFFSLSSHFLCCCCVMMVHNRVVVVASFRMRKYNKIEIEQLILSLLISLKGLLNRSAALSPETFSSNAEERILERLRSLPNHQIDDIERPRIRSNSKS